MSKKSIFDNKIVMWLISLCIALGMWTYVSVSIANEHTTVIRNVPINFSYRSSQYSSLGLDIIETDIGAVDVTITGPRSVTGDLTADDIIVYPNITGVDGAGKYTFTLTAEKMSSVKDFTIDSLSVNTVVIRLDTRVTKEFPVEVDISTLIVASDCLADMPTTDPSTIQITGPEYKINQISRVVAATVSTEIISATTVLQSEIRLYDENGDIIDQSLLNINNSEVDITIPVMKEVIVPVRIGFVNNNSDFNTDNLHLSLSVANIRLAVPRANARNITEYVAGYIDLNTLETDTPYEFELALPDGARSLDSVTSITATVSSANISEKTMDVSEINVINGGDADVQVLTETIKDVVICGDKDVIESLEDGDVIAQVDMSQIATATGQQTVEVTFVIPSSDAVYVKGAYTVNIRS